MLSWMILLSVTARHRIEKLENENEKLRRENEKLRHEKELVEKEKEKLRQERDRLKDELDLARRAAKRQAAPFSKGEPKTDPRRPGRKPGVRYGRKGHRAIPPIVDEEIKVPLPERSPCCGGAMESRHVEDQYQTEIVRQTRVTCFHIQVGNCAKCGKRIQGRDSRQTSDALGAAASQVGPEALSLATILNKELGIPLGKTTAVLDKAFGLTLTPGGLSQALARLGKKCEPTYQDLISQVRMGPSVTMDESGWKVGGHPWWLWVAVTSDTTVYGILPGRGYKEAARLLGAGFDGFLVHEYDRLFLYLNCPGLEATNWRGEQAIRPAVVARKVWGGNRTENGAHAQEVLTSVLRTSRQRAADPLPSLAALLRSPKSYVLDFGSHYPARC